MSRSLPGTSNRPSVGHAPAWVLFLVLPGWALLTSPAHAQVFQVQGGASSIFRAYGGSVEFQGQNYNGWVGLGYLDAFRFGAFLQTRVHKATLGLGDQQIPFRLPTDVFDSSHYFIGRGAGVSVAGERFSLFGFAGTTSSGFATPFFRAAKSEQAVGLLFMEGRLTPTLTMFSRNVVSTRQTSIHGVEWRPRQDVRLAVAEGLGANQHYFSSSLLLQRERVTVKAAYVSAGSRFRRIIVDTPLSTEVDKENILVTLRPAQFLAVSGGRRNLLQPFLQSGDGLRASMDELMVNANFAGVRLGAGLYDSVVTGARSTGTSLSAGRRFADRVDLNANLFHSRPARGPNFTTLVGTIRETVSPRLSLLQVVSRSNGQTSISFGGEFLSNRLSIGVEYQTLYLPFRTGDPFKQVVMLNLRLQPFGNYRLHAGTYVAPDGGVRYTVSGGTYLYRDHGTSLGVPSAGFTLPKFVFRGRVVDEAGNPVSGATVRVDGDTVFTDSRGEFFVRKRKRHAYQLEVRLNEFLIPGRFEVVSAPTTVTAARPGDASQVTIVLRRLSTPSP